MQFFWEKSGKKSRSRFNLLLLEYGEYFFEDASVYLHPFIPIWTDTSSIIKADSYKIQGRIKICSRSLIFEPTDIRRPLIKIPFKAIKSDLSEPRYGVKCITETISIDLDSFFIFSFKSYIEMKANDKITPYKLVDNLQNNNNNNNTNIGSNNGLDDFSSGMGCFSLVHSDLKTFLTKVSQLRQAYTASERSDYITMNRIMQPILLKASTISFDSSKLVDYHEQLLLQHPVAVKKVKPLVTNPGIDDY